MPTARTVQFRFPRLAALLLGSLLAIAAVLGATVMLGVALAATAVGALTRAWRGGAAPARNSRTIEAEYTVVASPQRGGNGPDSGGLATKASNELS